jgi:hypothetical protein
MEAELLPRKLAAILYADVAGYSLEAIIYIVFGSHEFLGIPGDCDEIVPW